MESSSPDLQRDIERLRKELERVAERATQRELDFGAVRAKAERVEALEEKVRELSRIVARLGGDLPGETRPPALGGASAAQMAPLAVASVAPGVDALALAVAEQLRKTGLLANVVRETVVHEPPRPGAPAAPADLAQRLRAEVDPKALLNALVERLLKEVDLKVLTQRVVDALVQRIEVSIRRPA